MPQVAKKQIKTIAFFCGSRFGARPEYKEAAAKVCSLLAADGMDLVYGGGHSGLMGTVSDAFRAAGRKITAVITHIFRTASGTIAHENYNERVVRKLSTRKQKMIDLADAFVILPGGFGTMDELFSALAIIDMQMAGNSGEFVKPVIVLNTKNVYYHLGELIKDLIREDFVHDGRQRLIRFCATPEEVVEKIRTWNREGIKTAAQLVQEIQTAKTANGNNQAATLKDMTGPA